MLQTSPRISGDTLLLSYDQMSTKCPSQPTEQVVEVIRYPSLYAMMQEQLDPNIVMETALSQKHYSGVCCFHL